MIFFVSFEVVGHETYRVLGKMIFFLFETVGAEIYTFFTVS